VWSPDSGRLASAGFDGTLRVWDATSGAAHRRTQVSENGHAVFELPSGVLLETDGDAWRWLVVHRQKPDSGEIQVWPAEALMPLPRAKSNRSSIARWA
jgi:WD40 repeat protein